MPNVSYYYLQTYAVITVIVQKYWGKIRNAAEPSRRNAAQIGPSPPAVLCQSLASAEWPSWSGVAASRLLLG